MKIGRCAREKLIFHSNGKINFNDFSFDAKKYE